MPKNWLVQCQDAILSDHSQTMAALAETLRVKPAQTDKFDCVLYATKHHLTIPLLTLPHHHIVLLYIYLTDICGSIRNCMYKIAWLRVWLRSRSHRFFILSQMSLKRS